MTSIHLIGLSCIVFSGCSIAMHLLDKPLTPDQALLIFIVAMIVLNVGAEIGKAIWRRRKK